LELLRRFRNDTTPTAAAQPRRTVADLLDSAARIRADRQRSSRAAAAASWTAGPSVDIEPEPPALAAVGVEGSPMHRSSPATGSSTWPPARPAGRQ
jgi:hypothetical protein